MSLYDGVRLSGSVELRLIRGGRVVKVVRVSNLVVDVGKAEVAKLIGGLSTASFGYMAVGTGTTPPAGSDTGLEAEVMRVASTNSSDTVNTPNDTIVFTGTFSFSQSYAITEAGIFNASTGGVMLSRVTFSALNVVAGDQLVLTWKITVG